MESLPLRKRGAEVSTTWILGNTRRPTASIAAIESCGRWGLTTFDDYLRNGYGYGFILTMYEEGKFE